jgi:peptidoglycan/LPS O-acetylase OafA/YrhL
LSYGVYLYHMPVINAAIAWPLGFGGAAALWVCTVVTLALAALSWLAIERPALRMKPRPRPTAQS